MFYNLKIAIRNLRQNALYSSINIAGLAVSLAAVILITLWVKDEFNRNKFLNRAEQIYQVDYSSPGKLAPFIKQEIPEALHVCRTFKDFDLGVLSYGDDKFTISDVCLADSSFFSVFSFKILSGNPNRIFEDKSSIVISESLAKRLFKEGEAIGKTIKSDVYGTFHITAVMIDMPQNSSLKYSAILPFTFYPDVAEHIYYATEDDWSNFYFNTYVMIADGVNANTLEDKISHAAWAVAFPNEKFTPGCSLDLSMLQLTSMHLYASDGTPTGMKNIRLFSIAALVLLLIACINYVNLVTARIAKRSKEAGIRKILGSGRIGLFIQMIRESALMSLLALLIATLLMFVLLPFYNELTGKQLCLNLLSPEILLTYLVFLITVTCIIGIYPAMLLSSLKPGRLSNFQSHGRSLFRKILVTTQFIFSAGLIITTIVLGEQLNYMKTKDPGYERENIFSVNGHHILDHYSSIKDELLKQGSIADVTVSSSLINNVRWNVGRDYECKNGKEQFSVSVLRGDYNLTDFFNIHVLAGQKFKPDDQPAGKFIVNEKLAEKLGWEDIIGRSMPLFSSNETQIIGKIEDFNFKSFHQEITPMVIIYDAGNGQYLYVKSSPGNTQKAVAAVEAIWKRYNDGYPFEYRFLDDEFDRMYKSDIRTGKLFNAFAIIAIFISCLGLFGLVTYTAETKTKEIGIHKVLGASVSNIVNMLSKEFLILVGIAMLIAFPLAYYFLSKMLQDYAYRISIAWWMFGLAAFITIALTLFTVGWQAMKAATTNPVKSIKTE